MVEIVEGRIVLELLVEIEAFGLVEACEVVVVYFVGLSDTEYAICLSVVVEVGMKLADIQQGMCIIPVLTTLIKGTVGANEENESEAVALVLFSNMCHAGIDTPAIDRVVYLCAVSSDIMFCGLGDLVSKTEMAAHVVVGFAELVVCEESAERIIECADDLLKCCGVVVEGVLGLIETISKTNYLLRLLPMARG